MFIVVSLFFSKEEILITGTYPAYLTVLKQLCQSQLSYYIHTKASGYAACDTTDVTSQ
jgi:hypothetical protein